MGRRAASRLPAAIVTLVAALPTSAVAAIVTLGAAAPASALAETVRLPSDAAGGMAANAQIYQVSCPAAGDCVAVGYYDDTTATTVSDPGANHQALIESESAGVWSPSEVPGLPTTGGFPAQPELTSVACPAAQDCVATDAFDESSTSEQGLIDTESSGVWDPAVAPLPVNVSTTDPGVEVTPVACPALGDCEAVGNYTDDAENLQGLIETQSPSGWTAAELQPPQGISSAGFRPGFYDLSCASIANCAAVGFFGPAASDQQGLLATESGGSWTADALDLAALHPATNPQAMVLAVSCPAAGGCTAVGDYEDAADTIQAFAVDQVAGHWQLPLQLTLPSDHSTTAAGGQPIQNDLYLNGISCPTVGNCTAVGSYDATAANDVEAFTVTESDGSWGTGVATALPGAGPAPATDPQATLDSVTCRAPSDCLATGTYVAAAGGPALAGDNVALVARQTSGGWTSAGIDLGSVYDAGPTASASPYWASVSCTPGGYCATGGNVADNSSGNEDAFIFDAPAAPAALGVNRGIATEATVQWTAPTDDGGLPVTGYTVTANDLTDPAAGGQTFSAAAAATGLTIDGLIPTDSYSFSVRADSLLGTGIPATTAAVAGQPAPPSAPGSTTTTITSTTTTTPTTTMTTTTASTTPSRAAISASLARLLRARGPAARLSRLRRTHRYAFVYGALERGRVSVRWYRAQARGHHQRRVLFAAGTAAPTAAGRVNVGVRLTAAGIRLLAHHGLLRLRLTAVVSFVGGGLRVSRGGGFVLD